MSSLQQSSQHHPSAQPQRGSCLCGAVRVTATLKQHHLGACHCSTCMKWGSGPFFAVECEGPVQFEGEENVSVYDSSDWAERGFCQKCGTHLFYRLKDQIHYALPFALFDADDWTFTEQVFIESKPGFYSFAQDTKTLTGAELFAQFQQL